jgi:polysaccharide biosynthesis/export protein
VSESTATHYLHWIDLTKFIMTIRLFVASKRLNSLLFLFVLVGILNGCAGFSTFFGSSGPNNSQVQDMRKDPRLKGVQFVNVDKEIANRLLSKRKQNVFPESFVNSAKSAYVLGAGDVISVTLWEAPPAMLFAAAVSGIANNGFAGQTTTFPEQMISSDGKINIPFAGTISVAGKTPQQVERSIVNSLQDKANQPQVLVKVVANNTASVTVVGEVSASARIPLTARGERLLDAIAAAGGVRQPVDKTTIQLSRANKLQTIALETIINNPSQNIVLQPGDVITAIIQPLTFTVLGAISKNQEIHYESVGISLAQALARAGGLDDQRSDARAVFVFRFEEADALNWATPPMLTAQGKVPVVYQINMSDPANFFVAQNFPVADKDVMYVSDASSVQLQKFTTMLFQSLYILKTFVPAIP